MGRSLDAKLVYGYDLGAEDLKIADIDNETYDLTMPWYDNSDDAPELVEQFERRLLAEIAGFTEVYEDGIDGYFGREREAEGRLGVEFVFYGIEDYSGIILAAHKIDGGWDPFGPLDLDDLASHPVEGGWDDKLAAAIKALGITPTQPKPGWLLCAHYG